MNRLKQFFIHRHQDCVGITLWRWKKFTMEIWFCPPNTIIEEHRHPNADIESTFLYGNAYFYRRNNGKLEEETVTFPKGIFTTLTIKSEHPHGFHTNNKWLIVINREWWKHKALSASDDFEYSRQKPVLTNN